MNCSVFRKRLSDYMEGCISCDLKEAMEKHLNECKACSDIYAEELLIDSALSENLKCDNVKFSSIASEVMKNIDTTKYKRNKGNRLFFNIKDYIPTCAAIAALITVSIIVAPAYFHKGKEVPLKPLSMTVQKPISEKNNAAVKGEEQIQIGKNRKYAPEFIRCNYTSEPKECTTWERSASSKYQACIVGRGVNGTDEGIGDIIVKNLETGKKWCFELDSNTNTRANTPKVLQWWDDENILVVFGYGYGTIAPGGDLYILNVETGAFTSAYEIKDKKNQIIDITILGNDLKLDMQIYDDMKWSTSHKEQWIISSFDIKLKNSMEVKNSNGEIINTINGR